MEKATKSSQWPDEFQFMNREKECLCSEKITQGYVFGVLKYLFLK